MILRGNQSMILKIEGSEISVHARTIELKVIVNIATFSGTHEFWKRSSHFYDKTATGLKILSSKYVFQVWTWRDLLHGYGGDLWLQNTLNCNGRSPLPLFGVLASRHKSISHRFLQKYLASRYGIRASNLAFHSAGNGQQWKLVHTDF